MDHFIPKEKLSKKKRKELMALRRTLWEIKPVTRTIGNKKKDRKDRYGRWDPDGLFVLTLRPEALKIKPRSNKDGFG